MTDHILEFRYSKDGGNNWSSWRQMDMGAVGDYVKRIRMKRFGQGLQWVFHTRVSSPQRRDILACVIQADSSE